MDKFELFKMRNLKSSELDSILKKIETCPDRDRAHYTLSTEKKGYPRIIAEIKKSSPTMQAKTVNPKEQALAYVNGGASAISVLTEHNYFNGSWEDLKAVTSSVKIPVLCKEFIYYRAQIDLAYLYGADLILLIARCLSEMELSFLYKYALSKKLTPLIEINEETEIDKVIKLDPQILMVNMRNLQTLELNIDKGIKTLNKIPEKITRVSASAMKSPNDVKNIFEKTKTELFLVGSAIMASGSPADFIKDLKNVH